uniref:Polypeptide N-acetylgalactosaminyltransferase n=1 Tax=Salvator merianae TaxID=96440 RepID=A0A8D0KP82_SALMN
MNRLRKLFRGSGRALAFIFTASVIWLLLDMAALKFSFTEINTQVLKDEMVRKGRERFRGWRRPEENFDGSPEEEEEARRRAPPPSPAASKRGGGGELGESRNSQEDRGEVGAGRRRLGNNGKGAGGQKSSGQPRSAGSRPAATEVGGQKIPVTRPRSPQVSSLPGQKQAREEEAVNVTSPPQTKPALPRGFLATHLAVAAAGRPFVNLTHTTATIRSKVSQKAHRLLTKGANRGRKEGLFLLGLGDKGALAERRQKLPAGSSRPEGLRESPPGLGGPSIPARKSGKVMGTGEGLNATSSLDLTAGKLVLSEAAKKGGSLRATSPGTQPKQKDTKTGQAKEVPADNRVVFISKEGVQVAFPTTQNRSADAKGNRLIGNHTQSSHDKSQDNLKAINATKGASLKATETVKATLAGRTELGRADRVSLVDKDQLRKINPRDGALHFTEDIRMHKVLTIDRTLVPRDPKAPGQFGRPAVVPGEKQVEAKRRWNEGNFNVYLSDLIPVDRAIDDTRPRGCSDLLVHNDLPTTSIIMCFVDEVWSTLLRSVHSVLNRSPPQYVKEIILVDDFSTKAYLKDKLDKYMAQYPKVRILHLKERHGLIRARLAGAEIARGDVLTFLDSHVECNVGWLEPLLNRIHLNRKKVACPVIEVISDKDMSYMTVDSFQRGIFTWPMNFGWKPIPPDVIEKNKIKETDIIKCPVMAGGLFSIDKKYFFELGTYDPGLDVWGGENMEISFKVWMCGGEIEIIPCSRVGHIFRNDNPYSFPKDRLTTVERNLARVAEVWLDEYKDLFYGHGYHLIQKNLNVGDLTQQRELRKRLQCKDFKWYLENVYPDLDAPLVKASGLIINIALAKCITVNSSRLIIETCDINNKNQNFNYTWLRLIQQGDSCVAPIDARGTLGLNPCDKRNNSLKWLHKSLVAFHPELMDHIVLEHLPQATCLEMDLSQKSLKANICSSSNPYQKWQFGNYYAD